MRGNTIEMALLRGRVCQAGKLFQYDLGQRLVIRGEVPAAYQVHFSNDELGRSKAMIGGTDGVAIPDEYLQSGEDIHLWVYVSGEDHSETEYHGIINVIPRAMPTDAAPTPVEQDLITQALGALNDAVENIDETVRTSLQEAKESGMFDGKDGEDGKDGTDGHDGVDGISPSIDVEKVGRTTVITFTDKEGSHTATITDGTDGDPTNLIDDTAGEGETRKTWSADKLSEKLDGVIDESEIRALIADAVGDITGFDYELVLELPTENIKDHTIYFLAKDGTVGNQYDEYLYVNGQWEKIGSTGVDIDISTKADKTDTVLNTTLSRGRKENTTVGTASIAFGNNVQASGYISQAYGIGSKALGAQSHAEGNGSMAVGDNAHAEGSSRAIGNYSHAEGYNSNAGGVYAHAEGYSTVASLPGAHAEGNTTRATADSSHAEGYNTNAYGNYSHAEGSLTNANGTASHAEGYTSTASGMYSHAEGNATKASGARSHAEGYGTTASDDYTHAEGCDTVAKNDAAHAEGYRTTASGPYSHSEGTRDYSTTSKTIDGVVYRYEAWGLASHTEGHNTIAFGEATHAEGGETYAIGNYSHAEGWSNAAMGANSHAEGMYTNAYGAQAHAEGGGTSAGGNSSHAEGSGSHATGSNSHAEGQNATANGVNSHAEGVGTTANGDHSHAEGAGTTASGTQSHAEGGGTTASGYISHAEGWGTTASGAQAHAEGGGTSATGDDSHAEGGQTVASGSYSHAGGYSTVASGSYSYVGGIFNAPDTYGDWPEWVAGTQYEVGDKVKRTISDSSGTAVIGYICKTANSDSTFDETKWINLYGKMNYAVIVGNGENEASRSNAYALDWDGTGHFAGDVYAGCNPDSTGGSKLAKESDVAPVIINNASGTVASFQDGAEMPVKDCVVSIEPVQDLHGQSSPYPAGGGINILPPMVDGTYSGNGVTAVVKDGVATFSGTTTASGNALIIPLANSFTVPSGTIYLHCLNSVANSSLGPAIENSQNTSQNINYSLYPVNRITTGITSKEGQVYDRIRFYIGNGVAISGTFAPMICLDNTARSYVPYSNICPITGFTGVNIARTGVNLLPKTSGYSSNGMTATVNADNSISISGTATGTGGYVSNWVNLPCKIKKGIVFTVGTTTNIPTPRLRIFPDEGSIDIGVGTNSRTVTAGNDITKFRFYLFTTANESYNFTIYPQVEFGSVASTYEIYQGTCYPISWQSEAGTAYSGSLDVTTGVLTVNMALVDMGTLSWIKHTSNNFYVERAIPGTLANRTGICTQYKHATDVVGVAYVTEANAFAFQVMSASSRIIVNDPNKASYTESQFKTAMSGVQLCYELSEPQTYQLTPVEIGTLLGQNHIWADCGDISVDYCADTKAYVDDAIPSVPVTDVQVNGTSILSQGVANVPVGGINNVGVIGVTTTSGLLINANGFIRTDYALGSTIKTASDSYKPITSAYNKYASFYGLAKAAGDSTQQARSDFDLYYTETAKSKISDMLNAPESVTGSTPSITGMSGVRYICGEVSTLSIVAPASGCIDVTFQSGSTPTVLTVTSAKTGVTAIKWANGFDPTSLDANTVYEINILDGEYGVVGSWT